MLYDNVASRYNTALQMIGDFRPCARGFGPMARMQNRHEAVADMAERGAVRKAQQQTQAAAQLLEQVYSLI